MLAHDGPVLMDVHVRRDENCYPMVAPGKGNHQMLGLPEVHGTQYPSLSSCVVWVTLCLLRSNPTFHDQRLRV
jgi:hypothetical protein